MENTNHHVIITIEITNDPNSTTVKVDNDNKVIKIKYRGKRPYVLKIFPVNNTRNNHHCGVYLVLTRNKLRITCLNLPPQIVKDLILKAIKLVEEYKNKQAKDILTILLNSINLS